MSLNLTILYPHQLFVIIFFFLAFCGSLVYLALGVENKKGDLGLELEVLEKKSLGLDVNMS